jgi:cell division protein FtsW
LDRRRDEVLADWWGFIKPMLVMGLAALLLLMEPDFGATVVIGCSLMGMIFLSGAKLTRFIVLLVLCSAGAVVLVLIQPYRLKRLTGFAEPWQDPFGDGYQLTQALIAFGRGEWTGVGLGNSVQKLFYLPEAHTDFVFSILAEEFGLVGVTITIILFSILVYRSMLIGRKAEVAGNRFNAYFAYGLGILFATQAFVNMGVNIGLLPTKGLTLPLVSYGGSSLLVCCMAIAVLTRIACETRFMTVKTEAKEIDAPTEKERVRPRRTRADLKQRGLKYVKV